MPALHLHVLRQGTESVVLVGERPTWVAMFEEAIVSLDAVGATLRARSDLVSYLQADAERRVRGGWERGTVEVRVCDKACSVLASPMPGA